MTGSAPAAPDAFLARITRLGASMGITRVAVLTGLDVIGIPVAAAIRPNSRSIAVHQGKGATLAAAKISAIMEAAEAFHGETILQPMHLASHAEMAAVGDATDPASLPRAHGRVAGHDRLLWICGTNLFSAEPLWVPHELVSADFTAPPAPGAGLFEATTNGLAAGGTWRQAAVHALCEVIERDAVALWWARGAASQDRLALDLDTVDSPGGRALLQKFVDANVTVQVWDVTSDVGLPVFLCLCSSAGRQDGVEPEFGAGCHPDRDVAFFRALSEAAQARLTVISGAREDVGPEGYQPMIRARREAAAADWLRAAGRRDYRSSPTRAIPDDGGELDACLAGLDRIGLHQAAWVDLTREDIGIPVGRIVVPGLEGPWTPSEGEYTPGARARAVFTA